MTIWGSGKNNRHGSCRTAADGLYSRAVYLLRSCLLPGVLLITVYASGMCSWAVSEGAARDNEQGVQALSQGNFHKAIELLRRAYSNEQDNPIIKKNLSNAYNNYGYYLSGRGDLVNAIENFERSVALDDKNVYGFINLGQAYYKANKLDKAAYCFKKAKDMGATIDNLDSFIDKISREKDVEQGLVKMDSTHFSIITGEKVDRENVANIKASLEQAYSRVGSFLGVFPEEKITAIIYPDSEYRKIAGGAPYWSHGVFDGKIRLPLGQRIYSKEFLMKVIYHEYTHAVVRNMAGNNCPMWLNEGIASYAEGLVETRDRSFYKDFITKKTFMPVSRFPVSYSELGNAWDANYYYRMFCLAAGFIIDKYGAGALSGILKDLRAGKSFQQILADDLSTDAAEFDRRFERYVYSKVGL